MRQVVLPLGGYTKAQVRIIARAAGLTNADRKDSYGICFIGKRDFKGESVPPDGSFIVEPCRQGTVGAVPRLYGYRFSGQVCHCHTGCVPRPGQPADRWYVLVLLCLSALQCDCKQSLHCTLPGPQGSITAVRLTRLANAHGLAALPVAGLLFRKPLPPATFTLSKAMITLRYIRQAYMYRPDVALLTHALDWGEHAFSCFCVDGCPRLQLAVHGQSARSFDRSPLTLSV